jgi:hypothetical protein
MKTRQFSENEGSRLISQYNDTLKQLTNLIASIERKIAQRGKSKSTVPLESP